MSGGRSLGLSLVGFLQDQVERPVPTAPESPKAETNIQQAVHVRDCSKDYCAEYVLTLILHRFNAC